MPKNSIEYVIGSRIILVSLKLVLSR